MFAPARSKTDPLAPTRRAWLRAFGVALCAWFVSPLAPAQDAALTASATSVKAAYLFKLPAYVDWPEQRFAQADSALTVGVVGADDVAGELAALTAGRTVNGRRVVVQRLRPDEPLTGVHVLFLGSVPRDRAEPIAAAAAEENILTVADTGSAAEDSVIEFVTASGKVRFEVRLGVAERNGLRLSAGLLNVAARVYRPRRG